MQSSGTWRRTYLTRGAIALAVLGVLSFLIAVSYQDLTPVAANSGAILVAGSYLCGLCVAWIDGRPIPLRGGGYLTKAENPVAYRGTYALMSLFGFVPIAIFTINIIYIKP